jgi:uncharacterized lipoprotein YbaY
MRTTHWLVVATLVAGCSAKQASSTGVQPVVVAVTTESEAAAETMPCVVLGDEQPLPPDDVYAGDATVRDAVVPKCPDEPSAPEPEGPVVPE